MKITDIIKDHTVSIMLNVFAIIISVAFLSAVNVSPGVLTIIIIFWLLVLLLYYGVKIYQTHKRLNDLITLAENLDKRYLMAEIMGQPINSVEKVYKRLLKMSGKSMMEQVGTANRESNEYREYIEQWIHDIKTPISGIRLLCNNNKSEWTRTLMVELEKIEHLVEQTLYYARSDNTAKDYIVRESSLAEIVHSAIRENKQLLLSGGVNVIPPESKLEVYTDKKWIEFIIGQLIINAVQYGNDSQPVISFEISELPKGVNLTVRDNGIGISKSDLPRIFEKGFTGDNGRKEKKSTGIGLYLCKRLCDKLGLGIHAESVVGEYMAVTLFFPKGTFSKPE